MTAAKTPEEKAIAAAQKALDKAGIAYEEDATIDELEALLPVESDESIDDIDLDDLRDKPEAARVLTVEERRKNLKIIIGQYKKQNPAKYEAKKDELQAKLDAIV